MRIRELYDRKEVCKERYWAIPKSLREEHGFRPEIGDSCIVYSGTSVLDYSEKIFIKAFRGTFPFESRNLLSFYIENVPVKYINMEQVYSTLEPLICNLEFRLDKFDREVQYT